MIFLEVYNDLREYLNSKKKIKREKPIKASLYFFNLDY